tara:strand:- start:90 stop:488 length:399 start_codon:yes stop_codon:yes gene_type:complete
MESTPINSELFQKKFPNIDFNTLELKPHTELHYCTCPQPSNTFEPSIDKRYFENDSRYITPEDKEKYEKEFEELQRNREIKIRNFYTIERPIEEINIVFEDIVENYDNEEDEEKPDSDEDYVEEYEFRSSKK